MPKICRVEVARKQYATFLAKLPDDTDIQKIRNQPNYQPILDIANQLSLKWKENAWDDPEIIDIEETELKDDESLMHGVKATINSESDRLLKICAQLGVIIRSLVAFSEEEIIYNGLVVCYGALLKIDIYPDLYKIIGNQYGGDGVKTFAVPDLRIPITIPKDNTFVPLVPNYHYYIKATKAQWEV